MVYFVGAGPGAKDLITVRGMRLLEQADVIIYAGSLVNPELLSYAGSGAKIYDSAKMTLEEVLAVIREAEEKGLTTVRLHTGEPSLYGAVREQMDVLAAEGIFYESCPGVSACFGAAADLNLEYTLPGISQSLIITRMAGRTAVPERESIESFAAHQASMAVYLSAGMVKELSKRLMDGGYAPDTPAAIVYKATWPDEEAYVCTVETLAAVAVEHQITKTALILVGDVAAYNGNVSSDESHGIIERQADTLASALLMPLPQIKKCFYRLKIGRTDEQLIAEMANIFEVSKQAMQIRLKSRNLI